MGGPAVYWITGPPASGKTTLCRLLLSRAPLGVHVPVDDLRLWVCSGLADAVPWTDETERQFQIAEAAACDVARRYQRAGFVVAVDHCRNTARLEQVVRKELTGVPVARICLMPDLEENLRRNRERTNKPFDPAILEDTITFTNTHYRDEPAPGWTMLDNTRLSPEETLELIARVDLCVL